jgi:hypothetical protein
MLWPRLTSLFRPGAPRSTVADVYFGPGGFLTWLADLDGSDLLTDDELAAADL